MLKIIGRNQVVIAFGAMLAVSVPETAHAYLDPGTGSVILQVVVAGVLGALFTFKTYFRSFKNYILRLLGRQTNITE